MGRDSPLRAERLDSARPSTATASSSSVASQGAGSTTALSSSSGTASSGSPAKPQEEVSWFTMLGESTDAVSPRASPKPDAGKGPKSRTGIKLLRGKSSGAQ